MNRFTENGSRDYDKRIVKLIPGYHLLHQLSAAKLTLLLPRKAKILVVGAGTGSEIIELTQNGKEWSFTAVDTSQDMLDIANSKFAEAGIKHRVESYSGDIFDLDRRNTYDAALCLFVMHFMPSHAQKRGVLKAIYDALKLGAPLLYADLMESESDNDRLAQAEISRSLGLSEDASHQMLDRLTSDFYPLNSLELKKMMKDSGFLSVTQYYQALRYHAYQALK